MTARNCLPWTCLGFKQGLLRVVTCVPSQNFKICCFAYWGGSHVTAVGNFTIVFGLLSVVRCRSFNLSCVVCHHFCCPMSLFQSHVSCRNFALTGPLKSWMSFHMWVTHTLKRFKFSYSWLPITRTFKGNRKRFELSGVRVIESSKKIAESMVKNSFYGTVNILITFNFRNVEWKLKDTFRL